MSIMARDFFGELVALFHNGKIGAEVCIKNIVCAKRAHCGSHAFFGGCFRSNAKAFAPRSSNRGSNLYNNDFFRVVYCSEHLFGVVTSIKRTHRAVSYALSAERTYIAQICIAANHYVRVRAVSAEFPNAKPLHFIANAYAAKAFYAL